jgi:hypothetical protein
MPNDLAGSRFLFSSDGFMQNSGLRGWILNALVIMLASSAQQMLTDQMGSLG